jgi:SpoVK/Ycf46/Vps4 family AAA+-type ATPase
VPNVKWEDVGGLEDVKKSILDTVQVHLVYPSVIFTATLDMSTQKNCAGIKSGEKMNIITYPQALLVWK